MTPRLLLLCLAALAGQAAARMLIEGGTRVTVGGRSFYVNPPQNASKGCSDVAPDDRFSCDQQKSFGACDQPWMAANYWCARTCGFCGFQVNPPQNASECSDTPPDVRYTCAQQRDFGKCRRPYITRGHFCARTCGLAPCPPVENLPVANVTGNVTAGANATEAEEEAAGAGPLPVLTPVPPVGAAPVAATPVVTTTPPIGAAIAPTPVEAAASPAPELSPAPAAAAAPSPQPATVVTTPPLAAAVAPAPAPAPAAPANETLPGNATTAALPGNATTAALPAEANATALPAEANATAANAANATAANAANATAATAANATARR